MAVVFVPRERASGESRVAATPETVRSLVGRGADVRVEVDAGAAANLPDAAYGEAGATVVDADAGWDAADLVLAVGPVAPEFAGRMREGAVLVGLLAAHRNVDLVRTVVDRGVTAIALELIPRITRAQRMDVLSSQANLAGYRAAILAAASLDKQFPIAMTAAGTIRPASVVVLGAGVAGLQAIATARRLGALVKANDIRAAARDEVESLGADFIDLEDELQADDGSGYAAAQADDALARQQEVLGRHLASAHAVITTAFVPGRPAPTLVTRAMVEGMQRGSVVIDLAAAEGGNCELTPREGEVEHGGVRIIAAPNLAAQMPGESSALLARNVLALAELLLPEESSGVVVDREDDVVGAALLVHDRQVVHDPTRQLLEPQEGATP